MTSNFTINYIFEENLKAEFNIIDGIFNTPNQQFILQHTQAIQNLKELNTWEDLTYNEDNNNYFEKEYRYSFDTNTWSNWLPLTNNIFNNFPSINNNLIWIQIKYVLISDNTAEPELKWFKFYGKRTIDEIFEPVILKPNEPVIFTNTDTYKVFSLKNFDVFASDINNLDIKFRYTQTQGRRWSEWFSLTDDNLQELKLERIKFANFQFVFNNTGNTNIELFDLELIGEFQNVTANYQTISRFGLKSQCNPLAVKPAPNDCVDNETKTCVPLSEALTPWNNDIKNSKVCGQNNFLNLNDKKLMNPLINLHAQLNEYVNSVNSWKVIYLLTDPDGKGIDHILHEQQIHNVIAKRDINIIVPDNQFPTDNISFNGLDLDLIQTFEIHIIKTHFKSVFGVEFRPGHRDVLYFCDTNQLWEVEQQFPAKTFMNAEFYYRVILKKYNENSSRDYANTQEGQDAKTFVNELTKHTTLDSMFFNNNQDEFKQNTKDNKDKTNVPNPSQQNTPTTNINIRKNIDKVVDIIEGDIVYNASLKVIKSYYAMPIKSKGKKLVIYNYQDKNINTAQNRALSMWFKTDKYNPDHDYTLFSNYDYSNNVGYKLTLYQGALTFTWNENNYSLPVGQNIQDGYWYCFLIQYDQQKQKCEIAVYRRQNENGIILNSSKLILVQKNNFNINQPENINHNEEIFIGGSNTFDIQGNNNKWYISNIRIYNTIINNRHIVLNENRVEDADLTELVDNAEKEIKLPNYGNL